MILLLVLVYNGVIKMLKNEFRPFIVWSSARTASQGFYYDYKIKNDQIGHRLGHIPIESGVIDVGELFDNNLSFCYHINADHNNVHLDYIKKTSIEKNYNHIILYRKDLIEKWKSLYFALATGAWHIADTFVIVDAKWEEYSEKMLNEWPNQQVEIHNEYQKILDWCTDNSLDFQLVEFKDAIKNISSFTGHRNRRFYHHIPEDSGVKEKLTQIMNTHPFLNKL